MTEIYKDYFGYKVSNTGKVINKYGRFISVYYDRYGYQLLNGIFNGKKKPKTIHRIVATLFIDNPNNKPCVNHIDGNKKNNNASNLEWCTYSENNTHSYKIGLSKIRVGDNSRYHKLNSGQVAFIKSNRTLSQRTLSEMFNVTPSAISLIKSNKNWNDI